MVGLLVGWLFYTTPSEKKILIRFLWTCESNCIGPTALEMDHTSLKPVQIAPSESRATRREQNLRIKIHIAQPCQGDSQQEHFQVTL